MTDPLRVYYSVSGSATNGADYVRLPGYAIIPAGLTYKNVLITPIDDASRESSETITISIKPHALYRISSEASVTVTLGDNDT